MTHSLTANVRTRLPVPPDLAITVVLIVGCMVLLPAAAIDASLEFKLTLVIGNAIAALGLNFIFGVAGLLSMAQAAAMAVGAYATGMLVVNSGMPLVPASILGVLAATITSALTGLIATRIRSHYFILLTLSYAGIVGLLIVNQVEVTGGANGMAVTLLQSFTYGRDLLVLGAVLLVLAWYLQRAVLKSSVGLSLKVAGSDEHLAGISGISTGRAWLVATSLGGMYAGVAGVVYTYNIQYLGPSDFDLHRALLLLLIIVLGGMGSPTGVVIAAFILTYLNSGIAGLATTGPMVYGGAIIILLIVLPGGLVQVPALLQKGWTLVSSRAKPGRLEVRG